MARAQPQAERLRSLTHVVCIERDMATWRDQKLRRIAVVQGRFALQGYALSCYFREVVSGRFGEERADDVFDLGFGDVEIGHWEAAKGFAADFADALPRDFQPGGLGLLLDDFAEGGEVARG